MKPLASLVALGLLVCAHQAPAQGAAQLVGIWARRRELWPEASPVSSLFGNWVPVIRRASAANGRGPMAVPATF